MGTIVNVVAIISGGLLGLIFKQWMRKDLQQPVMSGLGLCVLAIGINGVIGFKFPLTIIASVVIGTLIGNYFQLEEHLEKWINKLQTRFSTNQESKFTEGFIIASSVYVIGAMAIIGSIQSGLGNNQILFAKSMLDGVSAVFFAANYGIGVLFSALPVLLYQGAITLSASLMEPFFNVELLKALEVLGSLLIIAISLNMLQVKKISVLNMLPSLVMVIVLIKGGIIW